MSVRGRRPKPGHIVFVGSGPGDPGLLTTRARTVLADELGRLCFMNGNFADLKAVLTGHAVRLRWPFRIDLTAVTTESVIR